MKVLITGASGYIGKHIALQLLNDGFEVRASVRNLSKASEVRNAVLPLLQSEDKLDSRLTFVELDLEKDSGWREALVGVDALLHTASPFPIASPKNEDELIIPAVQGTLRALKAAHDAGVNRVVLTSSIAAIYGSDLPAGKSAFDESIYSDVTHPVGRQAYTKSKTLAEAAAWEYVETTAPEIQLTTINPVLVLGAPLDKNFGSSVSIIERILKGSDPMLPDLSFSIVHVKDVAKMHILALKNDAAIGQRIIASASAMSFVDIAKLLKVTFSMRKIKTLQAPNFIIRVLSFFDTDIKAVLPLLGDRTPVDSSKAKSLLGINFISAEETVIETAEFLIP
ncbi:MAG: SDR family oxidoreductase [Candidatus Planktophila sp.]